jgi:hypothetical protein
MPLWGWVLVGLFLGLIGAVLGFMATRKAAITAAPNKQNTATRSESVPAMVFTNAGVGSAGATPAGWHRLPRADVLGRNDVDGPPRDGTGTHGSGST